MVLLFGETTAIALLKRNPPTGEGHELSMCHLLWEVFCSLAVMLVGEEENLSFLFVDDSAVDGIESLLSPINREELIWNDFCDPNDTLCLI